MTREEAIKVAGEMHGWVQTDREREALETLIPELAESEDERIRKEIISALKFANDGGVYDKHIAYLEKQKETENISASTVFPSCWAEEPSLQKEQKARRMERYQELIFKDICKHLEVEGYSGWVVFLNALRNGEFQPKQEWSEDIIQKAVKEVGLTQHQIDWFKTNVFPPKQEWSEGEYGRLFDIEHYLDGTLQLSPDRKIACIAFLKSLHERFNFKKRNKEMNLDTKLQNRLEEISRNGLENAHTIDFSKEYENSKQILEKSSNSAEWSEEDEKMRQSIIKDIEFDRNYTLATTGKVCEKYNEQINWLKILSLNRKKINEGVEKLCSNEWSEEDERNIRNLESVLYYAKDLPDETRTELGNFLKSLRPQQNHAWSEEDEKMLGEIIRDVMTLHNAKNLDELKDKINFIKSLRPRLSDEEIKKIRSEEYTKGFNDAAFGGKAWKPSEQEKGALRTAIHILTDERSFPKAAAHLQDILDAFEGKESRKDWKPSEEQMEALEYVIRDYREDSCNTTANYLQEILDHLKNM